LNLGDTLLLQKDYDQSIEICRRALEIKPNHKKAQKKLETAVRLERENATGVVAE
jgi:tetratricopeptide (TPR) repeat protein